MAIGINTSGPAASNQTQQLFQQSAERLSSGKRINGARDDAAGLAITNRITSQIDGFSTAIRNAGDGISLVQTAGGALDSLTSNVQRIRELSVQAANGALNDQDRQGIQQEIAQLQSESKNILEKSNFNGVSLFTGESTLSFQTGPNGGDTIQVSGSNLRQAIEDSGLFAIDVSTRSGASQALDKLDTALESINSTAAEFGAVNNRFQSAIDNLSQSRESAAASRSRIQDADFAKEAANLIKGNILNQADIAIRNQANAQQQNVLRLLS